MWKYLKMYRLHNCGICLLRGSMALVNVGLMFVAAELLDSVIAADGKQLVSMLLLNLLMLFVGRVLVHGNNVLEAHTIALMNREMRRTISKRIEEKSITQFEQRDSGEYISWYINDIREAENQGFRMFYQSISSLFLLIGSVAAIFTIRAELVIGVILISVVNLYLSKHFERKVETSAADLPKVQETFTDAVKQHIASFPMWKSFRHLERFDNSMKQASKELEEKRYRFEIAKLKANFGIDVFQALFFSSITFGMYLLCGLGWFSYGIAVAGVNYIYNVQGSISGLFELRIAMAGSKPFFAKIEGEDAEEMEGQEIEGKRLQKVEREIEVRNLSFAYTDVPVLQGVNMKFLTGGKYVIVGASGCGKSTLLRLLLGDGENYQGEILFDGKDAKGFSADSIYEQVAYIDQTVFLYHKSIRDNITLGGNFTEEELEDALRRSSLLKDMESFEHGLDTDVGENGSNLSGGQRQRVAIARALIHNRSILIIDEGTSALDRKNSEAIEDALLDCEHLTVIMVSHHLREEKKSRYTGIYQMENGRCILA